MFEWLTKTRQQLGRMIAGMPLTNSGSGFLGMGTPTTSGEDVTPELAMTLSAVFLAVDLYGSAHAAMPCGILAKNGSKRQYADYNPAHRLIHQRPNPEMNAGVYWRLVENHRLGWGASFSEIEWNGRGEPKYIWPVEPWRVRVHRSAVTNKLLYEISGTNGGSRTVEASDMLIFPHVTTDGLTFKSAITYGAETFGGCIAAQKTGNKWFEAGGVPQGFVKHPQKMEKGARDNFRKEWRENAIKNRENVGILFEGMDWVSTQIDPESMQLLQTKQFGVIDIARFFKVQPNKLMDLMKSSYNTNEQADLEWVKGSILPAVVDKEQEINEKLVRYPDFYAKFNVEGLLRGDSAARAAWMKTMREIGLYSVNDIADIEDMDRIGPEGDIRVVNAAYIPLCLIEDYWEAKSQPGASPHAVPGEQPPTEQPKLPSPKAGPAADQEEDPQEEAPPAPMKKKGKLSDDPFFRSETMRMVRRENKAIAKAAKKPGEFLAWMDEFLEKHRILCRDVLTVPAFAFGAGPVDVMNAASQHVENLRKDLLAAAEVPASEFELSIQRLIALRDPDTE